MNKDQVSAWKYRKNLAPYIFISPFYLLFIVFMLYPYLYSFFVSFFKWNGVGEMRFIGLENYISLIKDEKFLLSFYNVFVIFIMNVPLMLFLALVFAVILNQPFLKFKGAFRAIIYIPNITNLIAVSYVFSMLFAPDGIMNSILKLIGIPAVQWLGRPMLARFSLSVLTTWRWVGYNAIIMLAGLQNISTDLYEAAEIDGASKVRSFFRITIPLMKPIIFFCTLTSTIGTVSMFAEPMILTQGNPMNSTLTPVLYLYRESFENMNVGYASSLAYGIFIVLIILTLIEMKVFETDK